MRVEILLEKKSPFHKLVLIKNQIERSKNMTVAKIEMAKNLQVKFSQYVNYYTNNLKKTTRRFIKEVSLGIIKTRSCIIRRIAQELDEDIDLKKVQERLSYQLEIGRAHV